MNDRQTVLLSVRILEECLEQEYAAEELRSKIRDILRLLKADHSPDILHTQQPTANER